MSKNINVSNFIIDAKNYKTLKQEFLFQKKAQGLAPRTLKDYNYTFFLFEKYYTNNILDLQEAKDSLLKMFASLAQGAPATFNNPYKYLSCFFNWLITQGYIEHNPLKMTGLHKKRDLGKIRNIPQDVIKRLLNIIDLNTFVGLRDYAFIVLSLDTGIRPCEACQIAIRDLDILHYELTIRAEVAKTRVKRVLPLSYQTVEVLKKLLLVRMKDWQDNIFLTVNGTTFSTGAWEDRIEYYSNKVGYKFTPYDFRHTFSIMFLLNGGNVFVLQRILGHSTLDMTKRYVKFTEADVANQHINSSPINNFIQRSTRIKKYIKNIGKEVSYND